MFVIVWEQCQYDWYIFLVQGKPQGDNGEKIVTYCLLNFFTIKKLIFF